MNVSSYLKLTAKNLADIPTARLDALVLLEDATGKDRSWLLAHPELRITRSHLVKLNGWVERRAGHEPLAYIRGKSEFYGREFLVTPATLQPRAETETMIDLLKGSGFTGLRESVIVDVGSGSGCIAITAKLEFPEAKVYATEINKDALIIAKKNAKNLEADVTFLQGNLLQPYWALSPGPSPLALLCNLPYVPNAHTINQAAMQEPRVAIFGGEDGLDLYREMFEQIDKASGFTGLRESVGKPKYIFTESLPFQHEKLAEIAEKHGYKFAVCTHKLVAFTVPYNFLNHFDFIEY